MMPPKLLFYILAAVILTATDPASGQQSTGKVPRIGFLTLSSASDPQTALRLDAFRLGLLDLGHVEGKNINIEYRYAEGISERLSALVEELVRLKVDLLVAGNMNTARVARKVTATIPIVVASAGDPIGGGLVASLARPGDTITGLYQFSPELFGKRLELLKEVVPNVSRFAFLNGADGTAARSEFENQGKVAAKTLAVQILYVEVKTSNPDLEGAFRVMAKERIGALITSSSPTTTFHRKRILALVDQNRIPAMHPEQEWANSGGLMSYGANIVDLYRRAAVYVDKILKGAKAGDLPIEQPTKFEFVVNLKTAKALKLQIPQSVLYRADKVIK
jgi:putative ABC transport system substrate-binding protein